MPDIFIAFARTQEVYFNGDPEVGIALTSQVAGRIPEVKHVRPILDATIAEYHATLARMHASS